MKHRALVIVVFVFSRLGARPRSRRHGRTVSANAKKPTSRAGFLYFNLIMTGLTALFLPAVPHYCPPRSFKLTIQTPSGLYYPA